MRRFAKTLLLAVCLSALAPLPADADFGLNELEVTFRNQDGSLATQAGSHPFEMRTDFNVNTIEEEGGVFVEGALRNLEVFQPEGFAGTPTPVPRCSSLDFLRREFLIGGTPFSSCPDSAALGYIVNVLATNGIPEELDPIPVYNLEPPPGVAARIGFWVAKVPVTVELGLNPEPPYEIRAKLAEASQLVEVISSELTLWGNPADPAHDELRGHCLGPNGPTGDSCPANISVKPFFTLPRRCSGPIFTTFRATPWWQGKPLFPEPGPVFEGAAETPGVSGCDSLGFAPRLGARPTTDNASSPSGLNVSFDVSDEGLANPTGTAHSDIVKTVLTLPEGVTANPSLAEGLATCSEDDLGRETIASGPGEGCPQASKIGTVEVESPLLEGELLQGALFVAEPYENRFGTLLALFIVIKHPKQGLLVKLAGEVEPNEKTGQLVSTFEGLPQIPFSHFRLRLREGGRSPLISPPLCGSYETEALLTPSGNPSNPLPVTSSFQITRGVGGAPCPPAGVPPFAPGFEAGSINASAGSYSPFYMRLTRRDGDQDMTKFTSVLPPGVVGKLAGISQCPDAAIAAAKSKAGKEELAAPSCPASSQIGRTAAGAGVGSQLTYVPGSLYMAGPVGGAPLSVVAITPAVAGPFDAGTVVVRVALKIDPRTARVEVDGANSDPIPHILQGIPLKVRDLHVHVDRSNFILNPTSCAPSQVRATLFGSFLDLFSPADDVPVSLATRYQAANCASLGFKPHLSLRLEGGTKRGDHPALRGIYRPRPGDANVERVILRLPRSAFLDQAHIRTICTRVQFAADACPQGAVYGHARAFTPLLDEPLKGPVYLRSSSNNLPDFVADLRGLVDVEAVARIDSVKGGIRATFNATPDAPISKVIVEMQGGKKGLIVNSRDLCAVPSRATVQLAAHNGRKRNLRPLVRASGCDKKSHAER